MELKSQRQNVSRLPTEPPGRPATPMVEFLLTRVLMLSATEEITKLWFDNNRTHGFRTSRCAAYLLDHLGDEGLQGQ